ncbi:SDR family oxidoreductase [Actinomadura vinacea]|uniref:SDR family oxidoreductase n=1 Tax=Actinomadura vinacea TaxID=115336 RepID=A0ABP5VRX2_9ACTN
MRGLAGKAFIVAGAGSGIGAAAAVRLAEEGASVVVGDLNAENAEKVAARIGRQGGSAVAVPFDIADESSVDALVRRTLDVFARVDGVHINAADLSPATFERDADPATVPLEIFDRTIAVNLRGHLLLTQRVLPELRERGGSIVYTASAAAITGGSGRSAYAMSKGGLLSLSRHVAHGHGKQGIRSNVVAPGHVLTEGVLSRAANDKSLLERSLAGVPSTRLGEAADIAAAVAFLLSDDATWINGQILSIDGGATMR